ncbi:MAG: DHH family phosphoesterase [Lachnospiraceae bacterium]|jgi:nanoRNase/pAp phosphatase (c-di-AMP/oligoRNAs hydrolase)|nr:DHH family phosphoesterase [Lachnospiraceae bacterium]
MDPLDLVNILQDHRVYIQTHNFPDPDAISSAFGLQQFLGFHGIPSTLCYDGRIDRVSVKKMLDTFGIAMYSKGEITDMQRDDFIVLVDSQKMNGNITNMAGKVVACIDHHPIFYPYAYQYQDIQAVGSCACIIASYFQRTGTPLTSNCAAALAYGIKMDTADLTRGTAALDMEMLSHLFHSADWGLVAEMYSNTMEFDDLRAYGAAIQNIQIFQGTGFAYIPFHSAQALVAIISDFILSLDVVDMAVVYARHMEGLRFSVRCKQGHIHAGLLIAKALAPYGSGGGHPCMAGGMIQQDKIPLLGENMHASIHHAFLHTILEMQEDS